MNDNKTVSFDKVKFKIKVEETKRKVWNGLCQVGDFCVRNKEIVIPMAIAIGGAGKEVGKMHKAHREDYIHEIRHWDPRDGEYYESKRKLKKNEKLEMIRRQRAGESKAEILDSWGLLKG